MLKSVSYAAYMISLAFKSVSYAPKPLYAKNECQPSIWCLALVDSNILMQKLVQMHYCVNSCST